METWIVFLNETNELCEKNVSVSIVLIKCILWDGLPWKELTLYSLYLSLIVKETVV